ncbi:hypothetical protein F5X96DRAFT_641396 [Biscogniauxia mediterranea]|nr:hypothetical protein F5X96DRAFT_641396 [Biscogniauxia mediterranea]
MSVCGEPGWPFCQQPGLPNWFCCASNATCISLAGNTTALCCPNGDSCADINVIPCNLTLQDPSTQQEPPDVQTSELRGPLPECGSACCPWGYSCMGDYCEIDKDQSKAPHEDDGSGGGNDDDGPPMETSSGVSSSAPLSPILTIISSVFPQESIDVIPTSQPSQEVQNSNTPISTPTIIGTAIGGFLGLLLVIIIVYLTIKLRQVKKETKGDSVKRQGTGGQEVSTTVDEPKAPELEGKAVHEM